MKASLILIVGAALFAQASLAQASESTLSSRSVGKLKADQSIDLSRQLGDTTVMSRPSPEQSEDYASRAVDQALSGIANRHDQLFEIYSADVDLLADYDGDGYHHALNVSFDVDVSYDSATVYAKLYLSREGGPWVQYFTTDLFGIHLDDIEDTYEVETELVDGYTPGYYAVLVEIYSLDHAYLVASEVLDYHYLGRDLALEDRNWDTPYVEEIHAEVGVSVGAGDASSLLVLLLIIQVVIAARGFLAPSPCKNSEKLKEEKNSLRCGP